MAEEKTKPAERVIVDIYGTSYPLRTDDPERMKELAAVLDQKMKQMARAVRSFDDRKIAVLVALQVVEEYQELKRDYDDLVALMDEK